MAEAKAKKETFYKEAFLKAKKYLIYRDVLSVILVNDREYTIQQVDDLLKKFLERKVK